MRTEKGKKKNSGFNIVVYPLCCLFAGVVWLAPFQYAWNYTFPLLGFIASLLLIDLIRQPLVSFLIASGISVGLCFYNVCYTACFAPFVLVYLQMRYAYSEKKVKSVRNDVFLFAVRLVTAAFTVAGFASAYTLFHKQPDFSLQFHREYVFLLVFIALFLFYALYKPAVKRENVEAFKKFRFACIMGACCVPAVFLYISALDPYVKLSALPAFLVSVVPLFFVRKTSAGKHIFAKQD